MSWQPETRLVEAERAMDRQRAMTVTCEYCGAGIGRECFDPRTGELVVKQAAHYRRLQNSGAI